VALIELRSAARKLPRFDFPIGELTVHVAPKRLCLGSFASSSCSMLTRYKYLYLCAHHLHGACGAQRGRVDIRQIVSTVDGQFNIVPNTQLILRSTGLQDNADSAHA
jgi:hypothetical protein